MTETESASQRKWRLIRERQEASAAKRAAILKPHHKRSNLTREQRANIDEQRIANHVDGYDRDDLGESPDF